MFAPIYLQLLLAGIYFYILQVYPANVGAIKIIIGGIKKEKRIIQFPLPTVPGAKLMRIVPEFLFEYISIKKPSNIRD